MGGRLGRRRARGGESPYEAVPFPDSDAIFLALENERVPAILTGTDNATYRAEQLGTIKLIGPLLAEGVNGMALAKDMDDLVPLLRDSLQEMIDDGSYGEILEEHGLPELALDEVLINPVTS